MVEFIKNKVGYNGINDGDDVEKVHKLFLDIPTANGGAKPGFKGGRVRTKQTDELIYNFQKKYFREKGDRFWDATVWPEGPTIDKLNELATATRVARFVGNNVQKDALAAGQLVYALNQSATDALNDIPGPWGSVQIGFCAGLAMRWIGLRATGSDYPIDSATMYASSGGQYWEAMRDHNIMLDVQDPGNAFLARFEAVIRRYGVTVNRTRYQKSAQAVSAAMMERVLFSGDGLYYFELRRKGGGHSISLERNKSTYALFDGNNGHFRIEGLQPFKAFATRFLSETGYHGRYTEGTWVVGANYVKST